MKVKFVTEVQAYHSPSDIDIDSMCIDIIFYNDTAGLIFINGWPIAAGATLSISGNENEQNTTKYKVSFNGNTGTVYVSRRKYLVG
jgi:hypothetical protein